MIRQKKANAFACNSEKEGRQKNLMAIPPFIYSELWLFCGVKSFTAVAAQFPCAFCDLVKRFAKQVFLLPSAQKKQQCVGLFSLRCISVNFLFPLQALKNMRVQLLIA